MQPIRYLEKWLLANATSERCLFTIHDLRQLYPDLSHAFFKNMLSRAVKNNILERICRGVYLYRPPYKPDGLILFRTAVLIRANELNYISLESTLSQHGVISQVPTNWVTIMTSGRSNIINCGEYGSIEFIHTTKQAEMLSADLHFNQSLGLWEASVALALKDMKSTKRNMDLIDWETANELI